MYLNTSMFFTWKTMGKNKKKNNCKNIISLCFYYFMEFRAFYKVPNTLIDEICSINVDTYKFANYYMC